MMEPEKCPSLSGSSEEEGKCWDWGREVREEVIFLNRSMGGGTKWWPLK